MSVVLFAADPSGTATLARRELSRRTPYRCPVCRAEVVLHAGRTVVAHFAHRAGSACRAAGESHHHLEAKRVLLDELALQGFAVCAECSLGRGRRADLLVDDGRGLRFTVEIQDSPISVDAMKARERFDRAAGCAATCWVFTERRVPPGVFEPPPWPARCVEARLPDEIRWRWHLTHLPVLCLHVRRRRLYGLTLGTVTRGATAWNDAAGNPRTTPARRLRSRHTVLAESLSFVPTLAEGRYGGRVVTFAIAADWYGQSDPDF